MPDAISPVITGHEVTMKRRLLATPGVAALAGDHAMRLWEMDITTFDPAIADALEAESKLGARYTALLASAEITIDGQVVNLAALEPSPKAPTARPGIARNKGAGRSSPRRARRWIRSSTRW